MHDSPLRFPTHYGRILARNSLFPPSLFPLPSSRFPLPASRFPLPRKTPTARGPQMPTTSGKKNTHDYKARLLWDGNLGTGTTTYTGYGRKYRLQIDGKPELTGSADPMFRGDANVYNPEDLFVAALSSCHLLSYLALCARTKINVVAYEDNASGILLLRPDCGGIFESVTLIPVVTLAPGSDEKRAMELHETAHDPCFIAASVKVPVLHEPQIRIEGAEETGRSAQTSTEREVQP